MAPVPISQIKVGHIDDVQELRKSIPAAIPERFIRDMAERPTLTMETLLSSTDIPVINHGIDLGLLESIEKAAMDFFMLPLEEKQKYAMAPGTIQGYGQAFVFSEDQKLDWCNMFALGLEPHFIRNPKLWPTKPAEFSDALEVYSREIRELCQNMLRYIAMSLGLNEDAFENMFGRLCKLALTVLQQGRDGSVGLQILRHNTWVPIRPIPNAFVINIGDTIEVLTNGKYKSVEHRAVTHKEKDRLSIVTFYAPSYEIELGPMPEFLDENNPCKYRRYNHGEYSRHYVTSKLEGKKTLDFAKIHTNSSS
ncbi:Protein SRG1 [Vitis vinifera]|uniref:Protein SRG1 n=1 Tax=Vitis vinifera TaxID=29760 RepID=A0A438F6P4_VITVI|nr:Protein SRG1 [Vitis vinifera]